MAGSTEPYSLEQVDQTLTAMIAFSGNVAAVRRELRSRGERVPDQAVIRRWVNTDHWERYEELRDKYEARIEAKHANDLLDMARRATEGAVLATEEAIRRIESGDDTDPARTAANLARVQQAATDKRLSLQGRPSRIVETRGVEENLRALVQAGLLLPPAEAEAEDVRGEIQESNPEPAA